MQSQQHDTRYDYDGYTPALYSIDDERQYAPDDGRYQASYATGNGRQHSPPPCWSSYSHQRSFFQLLEGEKLAAVFCYALGWLSGLLFLLFGGSNRFIRFHALQSLLFFGGISAFDIAFVFAISAFVRIRDFVPYERVWDFVPYVGSVALLVFLLLNFIAFVGWLVAMVQVARGASFKLPVAGNIAEKVIGQRITLK